MADDVEEIKSLMKNAFDQAFMRAIEQLFMIYSANAAVTSGQAERTKRGIENAIAAYRLAIDAVNSWES